MSSSARQSHSIDVPGQCHVPACHEERERGGEVIDTQSQEYRVERNLDLLGNQSWIKGCGVRRVR